LNLNEHYQDSGTAVCDRQASSLPSCPPEPFQEPLAVSRTLASYWRFLLAGLTNSYQTGAVVPSQRFLIDKMIAPVPPGYRGQILELGAGTGALTLRLAAKCPQARILACEINPVLAQDTKHRLARAGLNGRVELVSGAAEHLLSAIAKKRMPQPDFILSGIPLGNLAREQVLTLIGGINRALASGGLYIQFQYSLIDRKKIKQTFSRLRTVPVLLNLPPAFIYYAQK
jgi:phospholipid N-methyltransferase